MLKRSMAVLAMAAAMAGSAAAQQRDELTGKLVRITAPNFANHQVIGTVTVYAQEGLTVTERGTDSTYHFPLRSVQRIDIFRGSGAGAAAPRRARTGAFLGLALGALAGPVISIVTDSDMAITTAATAGGGLLIGAALGGVAGAAAPSEQWTWNVAPWGYDPNLRPASP